MITINYHNDQTDQRCKIEVRDMEGERVGINLAFDPPETKSMPDPYGILQRLLAVLKITPSESGDE